MSKTAFETYLKKYCESYDVSPEEAEKHKIIQEIKSYYEDDEL